MVIDGVLADKYHHQSVEIFISVGEGDSERIYQPFYVTVARSGIDCAYGFRLFLNESSAGDDSAFQVLVQGSDGSTDVIVEASGRF